MEQVLDAGQGRCLGCGAVAARSAGVGDAVGAANRPGGPGSAPDCRKRAVEIDGEGGTGRCRLRRTA
jgi:hypothetical protein